MTLHVLSPRALHLDLSEPSERSSLHHVWFWTNRRIFQQKQLKALFVSLQQILLHTLTWLRLIDVHWTTCGCQRLQLRPGETNPMCAAQFYFIFFSFLLQNRWAQDSNWLGMSRTLVLQKQTKRLSEFMYCWFWKWCMVGNSNNIVKFIWSRDWGRVLLHVESILFISKRCCSHNGRKLNKCKKNVFFLVWCWTICWLFALLCISVIRIINIVGLSEFHDIRTLPLLKRIFKDTSLKCAIWWYNQHKKTAFIMLAGWIKCIFCYLCAYGGERLSSTGCCHVEEPHTVLSKSLKMRCKYLNVTDGWTRSNGGQMKFLLYTQN